jgi:dihydroorotase
MGTTMSKLLSVGMPFEAVIDASTRAPMEVIGLPTENLLSAGTRAEFTVFEVNDSDLRIVDSMGYNAHLPRLIEPIWTILGQEAVKASRYVPQKSALESSACPHCGWINAR